MPSLGSQPPPCSQDWQISTKVQSSCRRPALWFFALWSLSPSCSHSPASLWLLYFMQFSCFSRGHAVSTSLGFKHLKKRGKEESLNKWVVTDSPLLWSRHALPMWLVNLSSCCFYSSSWDLNKKGFCCFIGGANSLKQAWILLTHF